MKGNYLNFVEALDLVHLISEVDIPDGASGVDAAIQVITELDVEKLKKVFSLFGIDENIQEGEIVKLLAQKLTSSDFQKMLSSLKGL